MQRRIFIKSILSYPLLSMLTLKADTSKSYNMALNNLKEAVKAKYEKDTLIQKFIKINEIPTRGVSRRIPLKFSITTDVESISVFILTNSTYKKYFLITSFDNIADDAVLDFRIDISTKWYTVDKHNSLEHNYANIVAVVAKGKDNNLYYNLIDAPMLTD